MSLVERCIHQFLNPVWEGCKTCAYDLENNKKCPGYSKTSYEIKDIRPEDAVLRVVKFNSPESSEDSDIKEFIA